MRPKVQRKVWTTRTPKGMARRKRAQRRRWSVEEVGWPKIVEVGAAREPVAEHGGEAYEEEGEHQGGEDDGEDGDEVVPLAGAVGALGGVGPVFLEPEVPVEVAGAVPGDPSEVTPEEAGEREDGEVEEAAVEAEGGGGEEDEAEAFGAAGGGEGDEDGHREEVAGLVGPEGGDGDEAEGDLGELGEGVGEVEGLREEEDGGDRGHARALVFGDAAADEA